MFSYKSYQRREKARRSIQRYQPLERGLEREIESMRKQWRNEEERGEYVEHLKDYFGEFIKSEEEMDEAIEAAYLNWNKKWDFAGMDAIRHSLIAKGHDVPFRTSYRRKGK